MVSMRRFTLALALCGAPCTSAFVMGGTARAKGAFHAHSSISLGLLGGGLRAPANVGEAKEAFQGAFGRPVNAMQQGFVNEMLTELTLLQVSPSYRPSRVTSLGFNSLCSAFLSAMDSEAERALLRSSLCVAAGLDEAVVASEAEALLAAATGKTEADILASEDLQTVVLGPFKYSYPFAAGLIALMTAVGEEPSKEVCARWSEALKLPKNRLQKDWEFYEDSSRKILEGQQMLVEMKAATKRKEAQKLKDEAEKAAAEAAEAEKAATEA